MKYEKGGAVVIIAAIIALIAFIALWWYAEDTKMQAKKCITEYQKLNPDFQACMAEIAAKDVACAACTKYNAAITMLNAPSSCGQFSILPTEVCPAPSPPQPLGQ